MKIILFLLALTSITVQGQTKFSNVQECLDFARANNHQLKIESLNEKLSEEKLRASWASLLPQVRAFGSFDDNLSLPVQLIPAEFVGGNEGEYAKVKFGTQFNAAYGAEASLSLLNISNWKNVQSNSFAAQSARFQTQDKLLSITEQIIASYYYVLLSRESILLNQDLANSADSLLDAAEVRFENGLIETLELNRVKAINIETHQQLDESKSSFIKNLNNLKLLCGLRDSDSLIVSENISSRLVIKPTALQVNAQMLPRFKMYQSRASQMQEEMKKQRMKVLPEISVYARYSRQAFRDEFNFFETSQPWFDVAVAGVRAEWNLFTGFNRQASIRQAATQVNIAELDLENYHRQADRELEDLRINHDLAAAGVDRFQQHYLINSANHTIANKKYSEGVYSIDQYITIYQEVVRSQNQYLSKLANFLVYDSIISTRNSLK